MYQITNEDLRLVLQQSASCHTPKLLLEVLDNKGKIVSVINVLISGSSLNIDSGSDVRRTGSFTVQPTIKDQLKVHPDNLIWLNYDLRLKVGLYNIKAKQYKYYTLAYFVYNEASTTYNAVTNQISFNCSDFVRKLDGTKNGQISALLTKFPAYEEDELGNISYNIIRDAIITVLTQLCNINNYRVDDICEYKALPDYNEQWESYRKEYETWNAIPYDMEFSCGCSAFSILSAFRDLYPNYEMFFDPTDNNRFICQLIPFCYEDDIILDNDYIQKVLISENTSINMSSVKNMCRVWGKIIDCDFFTETCSYNNNTYQCTVQGFDSSYYNKDSITVKIPSINMANPKIKINNLSAIPIYDDSTNSPLAKEVLKDDYYSFEIRSVKDNDKYVFRAYLLGQWQAEAMDVLSNGRESSETYVTSDGEQVKKYSQKYFEDKYGCKKVNITIIANSPFTVEKIGEILDVKSGNEYENINSDSLALDRAIYENWKNCRLTDEITITTLLLPFLDVNVKVSYKPKSESKKHQYIIKSINHNFDNFTSTISMYRFYPTYDSLKKFQGTHIALSGYKHGELASYNHDELTTIMPEEEFIDELYEKL